MQPRRRAEHLIVHGPAADRDGLDPRGRGQLEQEQPDAAAGAEDQQPAARRQASRASTTQAVPAASGVAAASVNDVAGLSRRGQPGVDHRQLGVPAGAVGKCVIAITRSPGARPVTPAPTLSMTPAMS